MGNVITLKNVTKVYGKNIQTLALNDINLNIKEGSFNAIIGESGSGKSTMLNIIGTLDKPTSGDVIINGKNIIDMDNKKLSKLRNETIGFIFQFHYLLPEFTVIENILMPSLIRNKVNKNRAFELLSLVGLEGKENKKVNELSGGQQQRVAIARALINDPKIVLADEPTGNLDSSTTESIYNLLRDINIKLKTTFIIITHDKKVAEKADRIIEIKDGVIDIDIYK